LYDTVSLVGPRLPGFWCVLTGTSPGHGLSYVQELYQEIPQNVGGYLFTRRTIGGLCTVAACKVMGRDILSLDVLTSGCGLPLCFVVPLVYGNDLSYMPCISSLTF